MNMYKRLYLDPTEQSKLLKEALIIFDTSALLDLYYYSNETQDSLFNTVFEYFKDRLWIPERVNFEYLKNREKVSSKPILAYESLLKVHNGNDGEYTFKMYNLAKEIEKGKLKDIESQLKTLKERTTKPDKHPYIEPEVFSDVEKQITYFSQNAKTFINIMEKFNAKFTDIVNQKIKTIRENGEDRVSKIIERKFKVGREFSFSEMLQIAEEGELRYRNEIPPGYEDESDKKGLAKYGDLIIWKEILDYAKEKKESVIFVCNDVKKDWYDQEKKKSARFELLKEFNSITEKNIWLYNMSDFLYIVNKLLDSTVKLDDTLLKEVENATVVNKEEETRYYKIKRLLYNLMREEVETIKTFLVPEEVEITGSIRTYQVTLVNGLNIIYSISFIDQNVHYTRILNPLRNIQRIKEYYGVKYRYVQIFIALSKSSLELSKKFFEKERVDKLFNSEEVEIQVGYIEDDNFICVMHNDTMNL